ncbi:MAG TPA: short-chain dehydrogenase/reductase [Janthinobacterium sp.]|nr:short-chain dehydrogenase/reductase [Janthinobacterium sp.]
MHTATQKTVLITGSSSGIGRATALLFAERGWQVAATMRDPADAGALADLPDVAVVALDVADQTAADAAVAFALERFGRLDAVVNNAGFGAFGPFETAPRALIERQLATNVEGVFNMTRAALPAFRAQGSGVFVNLASVGGLLTMPLNAIYHATKYAVVGFTEGISYELAPLGIRAKVVCPGGVATDFAGRSLARTYTDEHHPYADTVASTLAAMAQRSGGYSQPEVIAKVIFEAATDASPRVCYLAGRDAEDMVAARASMGEADYLSHVRQRFGLVR